MHTDTVTGTYGSGQTPCNVLKYEDAYGSTWYCVEGSVNVNLTHDPVEDGVDVETLQDVDVFTWSDGINSEDELEAAVLG